MIQQNEKQPKLYGFCKGALTVLSVGFLSILSVITVLITMKATAEWKYPMVIWYAPFLLIALAAFAGVISIPKLREWAKGLNVNKIAAIAFLYGLITSILWVLAADTQPMYDCADVLNAASVLWGDQTHRIMWEPGFYVDRFPYQVPFIWLVYWLHSLAGSQLVNALYILNAFANGIALWCIVKMTDVMFDDRRATCLALVICVIANAYVLYTTFIYGNTIAIMLMLASFYLAMKALKVDPEQQMKTSSKAWLLVFAALLLAFAIIMKSTIKIAAIAFAIIILIYALKNKKYWMMLFMVVPLLLSSLLTTAMISTAEKETGAEIGDGIPMTSWIVMGTGASSEFFADTQNNDALRNNTDNCGYFDAYIWYNPEGDSNNAQAWGELNSKYLSKRIEHFKNDPGYALAFFGNKIAIEWCEPTHEGFQMSNMPAVPDAVKQWPKGVDGRQYTDVGEKLYHGTVHKLWVHMLDFAQSVIAIGALAAFVCRFRKEYGIELYLPVLFVLGGALLYLAWENKSQYTLMFYMALIPYAAFGWTVLSGKITTFIQKRKLKKQAEQG